LRVRPDSDGARIDVRSASRYGRHDFGTNAARIKSLLEDIDNRVSEIEEQKLEKPQPKPKKQPPPKGEPSAKR
jgi:RNA processing factor Prp31